jgi:hypothetical protein
MADCQVCGRPNPDNARFCSNCGSALSAARPPAPVARPASGSPPAPAAAPIAPTPAAAAPSRPGSSILDSLRALGFRPTCGQIAGFVGAAVFGMALARALPFIFPIFYPALNFVFRDVLGREPDAFNTAAMTWLTCLSSAGIAFVTTALFGRKRKRSGSGATPGA